tara:strand:+ start:2057 stop:3292 length:1236 start_codon:yes stop_codon:yes gene_type:complete
MGVFSKFFKGVKNVFKKIGKGIKSAFKSIGKFVGKLGIVGQIGLGLFMPYLGGMLGKWAIGAMGSSNAIVSAAGNFVNAAINVGTRAGNVFKSVTEGVMNVVGETVGAVANNLGLRDPIFNLTGGKIDVAGKGFGSIFDKVGKGMTETLKSGKELFSTSTFTDTNPFGVKSQIKESIEDTTFDKISEEDMFDKDGKLKPLGEMVLAKTEETPNKLFFDLEGRPTSLLAKAKPLGEMVLDKPGESIFNYILPPPERISSDFIKPEGFSSLIESQMSIPEISETTKKYLDTGEFVKKVDIPTDEKSFFEMPDSSKFLDKVQDRTAKTVGTGIGQQLTGTTPEYKTEINYSAIPTIDLGTTSGIRMARNYGFDPRAFEQNIDFFNQNPYGSSAVLANVHSQYKEAFTPSANMIG